jgi:hypothetical protein
LDFLKIDTDGMEAHVLRGARRTLRELRPAILFELVPENLRESGESAEGVVSLLTELGYRLLHEGTLVPWRKDVEAIDATERGKCVNVLAWPSEKAIPAAT